MPSQYDVLTALTKKTLDHICYTLSHRFFYQTVPFRSISMGLVSNKVDHFGIKRLNFQLL